MKVRSKDGCFHYSTGKAFADSPAHYKAACENEREPTPAMILGTATHAELFGPQPGCRVVVFPGESRRAAGYKSFCDRMQSMAENYGIELTVITRPVAERAKAIADAVRAQDAQFIDGPIIFAPGCEYEVPMNWTRQGIECATRGIDVLNRDKGYIVDFKTTTKASPYRWKEFAWKMGYHVQAAMYVDACRSLDVPIRKVYCIGAEVTPPYGVGALVYHQPMLAAPSDLDVLKIGGESFSKWLEELRQCEESNDFPSYRLEPIQWTPPDWYMARGGSTSFDDEDGEEVGGREWSDP